MRMIKSKKLLAATLAFSLMLTSAPAFAMEQEASVEPSTETQTPDQSEAQAPEVTLTVPAYSDGHYEMDGTTVVSGLLLVNKQYSLPAAYAPSHAGGAGQSSALYGEANQALQRFLADCNAQGNSMYVLSAYRSYNVQSWLFQNYAAMHGTDRANTFSARAGQSEHQSGLSFDVGDARYSGHNLQISIEQFPGVQWMMKHCADYGFILRFPKGKENITGYQYEPWHFRYVGVKAAQEIKASGLTLEEFIGAVGDRKIAIGHSDNNMHIDGEGSKVSSYTIDQLNYFRLRDLATILKGTDVAFEVDYDAEKKLISITSHTDYTDNPTLIRLDRNDIAVPNTLSVMVDGKIVQPKAYTVDGFTYFKLRDLGDLLGFGVSWDSTLRSMVIDTKGAPPIKSLIDVEQ